MPDRSLTYSRAGVPPGPPNPPDFIDLKKLSHCTTSRFRLALHRWRGAPRGGSSVSRLGLFDDGSALPLSDALAAQLRVEPHRVPCQVLEVCEAQAHAFRIPVVDMVRLKFILAEQDDTLVPLMLR